MPAVLSNWSWLTLRHHLTTTGRGLLGRERQANRLFAAAAEAKTRIAARIWQDMSRRSSLNARARGAKNTSQREVSRPAPFLSGRNVNTALCIMLAAATIAFYSPVIGHPFVVLDDGEYVTTNIHIRSLGWNTIKWAFTSTDAANWHPITWLSHALDYRLFALNAAGHHVDSLLIHVLNAALLFVGLNWLTKRAGPSILVAALFAMHPINVESVAWVAERKNVLSTLFFLLALGAYAWYARKPAWHRYLLMALFFSAGLMAKPMLVTLPFVLLLVDYWPLGRMAFDLGENDAASSSGEQRVGFVRLVLEKVPLLFLSTASSWMTVKAQRTVVRTFDEYSFIVRIENAVVAYGLYLWKMVWPAHLAFYPHAVGTLPAWQWILCALVLTGVTPLVIVFRRKRYLTVGWLWFLGTLVPVIGLVQVGEYAMADRYAYIPLIGIFIMIAWGLADLAQAKNLSTVWCAVPALCVLAGLGSATYHQTSYWESDYDLWSHTLEVAESPFAHNAAGVALMSPGADMSQQDLESFPSEQARIEEARHHFERALQLRQLQSDPAAGLWDKARTLNNLGNLDRMQNRLSEAREHQGAALEIYRQLARQNPDAYLPYLAGALSNMGSMARLQNHLEESQKDFEDALEIERQLVVQNPAKYLPNMAMMLNEFGMVDAARNRFEAAREHFEEALKIDRQLAEQSPAEYLPQLATTLTNFGLLDAGEHRLDIARTHFEEAVRIDRQLVERNSAVYLPNLAMELTNLGRLDRLQNRIQDSRTHYEEALGIVQELVRGNGKYAGELAQIEASLRDLPSGPPQR